MYYQQCAESLNWSVVIPDIFKQSAEVRHKFAATNGAPAFKVLKGGKKLQHQSAEELFIFIVVMK